jgi:NTE family protein
MRNVALVLSSGGARGCAHIGVIKILGQNGFRITSIAGKSLGALVGGVFTTDKLNKFEVRISAHGRREVI